MSAGCPYIAGPACSDCDGSCWEPVAAGQPPQPDPCQVCSMIVGGMAECEGLCVGVNSEAEFESACERFRAAQD